eukprot:TRINITY_DN5396_c0_g1_i4.p1 TRINITY_DN5396_c0_g1~~TRINITY_DN5396_c0_g1_i4.p1  ORF type:complete len:325 (-),score=24.07 TRINITY_DN5396_c0_g1_i4:64-1038(-)
MKIYIQSYNFALALVYLAATLLVIFQLLKIIYYKHNLRSFQVGFLLFCLVWGVLRCVFWLLIPWNSLNEQIIQGLSLNIQFATFSFLALYFARLVHRKMTPLNERFYKVIGIVVYLEINLILLTVQIFFMLYLINRDDKHVQVWISLFVSLMYFLLSLSIAIYGGIVIRLIRFSRLKVPFVTGKGPFIVGTVLTILVFFSRGIRDALAAWDIGVITLSDPSKQSLQLQIFLFVCSFVWEIVPTVLVIILFWRIPKTMIRKFSRQANRYANPQYRSPIVDQSKQGNFSIQHSDDTDNDGSGILSNYASASGFASYQTFLGNQDDT